MLKLPAIFKFKTLQDREKEHKILVCQRLNSAKLEPKFCQGRHYKTILPNLLLLQISPRPELLCEFAPWGA